MSPIAIRELLRPGRHQLALVAAVLALGAAIAAHHSTLPVGDVHHAIDAGAVADMCLGVLAAVGAAVVAAALGAIAMGRWRPSFVLAPVMRPAGRIPEPRGRDGPALLRLLCVCRR